ncbi:MAG TPA: universal stress protein [Candidatus Limisoma gallistercoris]|nr:universal stress protein [Candidatus Limisoma gallistercoris]
MSDDGMVTLVIYTYEKAIILKNILEKEGIKVVVDDVCRQQPLISSGVRLCVSEKDLPHALSVVDSVTSLSDLRKEADNKPIVLVPVDFSEYSLKACEVGFHYAYENGLPVVVLNSYIGHSYSGSLPIDAENPTLFDRFRNKGDKARTQMRLFKNKILESINSGSIPDVPFKCEVMEGIPETAILEYAKNAEPALIVMGTRGKHKKEEDLIGSVTAEVLDSVKYPMLVIPEGITLTDTGKMKSIIFYCNLEQQDLLSFDVFINHFDAVDTKISLVHVIGKREKFVKERMDAMYEYCTKQYPEPVFNCKLFDEDSFLNDFEDFLRRNAIELVVIPNKKRNIFTRLFNPSIAHRILFHTDIPMLVVPIK